MTVSELRALLETLPDNAEVVTEGCDCIGGVTMATVHDLGVLFVVLRRHESPGLDESYIEDYLAGNP